MRNIAGCVPGPVPHQEAKEFTKAQALVRGIYSIAGRFRLNPYRRRARGGGSLDLPLPLERNWLRAMVPMDPGLDSRGKK
jgi:hypothetical protein